LDGIGGKFGNETECGI